MKDSTPTSTPTTTTTTAAATTTTSPTSPTATKEKSIFRDTRAELAQLLKKKEEIEVC
jgi:hypothetical protein